MHLLGFKVEGERITNYLKLSETNEREGLLRTKRWSTMVSEISNLKETVQVTVPPINLNRPTREQP